MVVAMVAVMVMGAGLMRHVPGAAPPRQSSSQHRPGTDPQHRCSPRRQHGSPVHRCSAPRPGRLLSSPCTTWTWATGHVLLQCDGRHGVSRSVSCTGVLQRNRCGRTAGVPAQPRCVARRHVAVGAPGVDPAAPVRLVAELVVSLCGTRALRAAAAHGQPSTRSRTAPSPVRQQHLVHEHGVHHRRSSALLPRRWGRPATSTRWQARPTAAHQR